MKGNFEGILCIIHLVTNGNKEDEYRTRIHTFDASDKT